MLLDRYRSQEGTKSSKKVYELITQEYDRLCGCEGYHQGLVENLQLADSEIYALVKKEYERVRNTLQLTAAQNHCSRAVLAALGSVFQNKTAEGSIQHRMHGGCKIVDELESLATERVKAAFGARYANVQPHSGSAANYIVFQALLKPGDTILSMQDSHGGHPSHGGNDSAVKSFYNVETYGVEPYSYMYDYEKILAKSKEVRPKLIVCGASIYPRTIEFHKFRSIADEVGAYLLADISHIAGQIIAGVHPSPIDSAHIITTSTYKAGGPRGGLILSGSCFDMPVETAGGSISLFEAINKATFPGVQGTPYFNNIAAKAVFFKESLTEAYRDYQFNIVRNAASLSENFGRLGFDIITGRTDNHMVLIDVSNLKPGLTGEVAQRALQSCGIVVDSFELPQFGYEQSKSALRLGTPIVTKRGMKSEQMFLIAAIIKDVIGAINITDSQNFEIAQIAVEKTDFSIHELCEQFPLS